MNILRLTAAGVAILAATQLLTACSGNDSPPAAPLRPATRHSISDTATSIVPITVHKDRRKSWVSPDVRTAPRLLFISDAGTDDVYIFTLPTMTLKGTLTGFNQPEGLCSDAGGNIWVTNINTSQIFQYTRAGTLMKTLTDPGGFPVGCAVDRPSGDLAVTEITVGSKSGDVLVYPGGSGTPARYTCTGMFKYFYAGYGPGGSLWVDGQNSSSVYELCGGTPSGLSQISISGGTVYYPGAVEWDAAAGTWVVFDTICHDTTGACSYPVSGSGVLGTPTTYLNPYGDPVCDLGQAVMGANGFKFVGGGDYEFCKPGESSSADRWGYTAGGNPTSDNQSAYESAPVGAAISTK